jgi:hypothetical protein
VRSPSALALVLALVLTGGCGGSSSDGRGEGTAPGGATAETTTPEPISGRTLESEGKQKKTEKSGRGKGGGPSNEVEKPKGSAESKAAQHAIERDKRLRQQTSSRSLTREELEEIAEEARSRAERLVDPPAGKTAADVLREIEEETVAGIP